MGTDGEADSGELQTRRQTLRTTLHIIKSWLLNCFAESHTLRLVSYKILRERNAPVLYFFIPFLRTKIQKSQRKRKIGQRNIALKTAALIQLLQTSFEQLKSIEEKKL